VKPWNEFMLEEPERAVIGKRLLFSSRPQVGVSFLATLRKDGAPRLHPVSLVYHHDCLYVLIPPTSPKCTDLKRDSRYALQPFPPQNNTENEEFYIAGRAEWIRDATIRQALIADTKIRVEVSEVLFELHLERAIYTRLVNQGTPYKYPEQRKWRAKSICQI
jgi:hypothetical protein